ncbi:amino acid adenylation domain-containing protein [Lysobacter pythonis]|uniref:Amino acid adenylation domain-containing protein n=1 Tax=Solilutibacter pythonis TaxID=2483112 RepID=A0A3M2HZP4_9GAMM|nr:non-ribosomal peptide synthetase [Lysobacter pythonis]RMH93585.1 amino acid adenylation domain-containing protein [Lysobacter pythonis]
MSSSIHPTDDALLRRLLRGQPSARPADTDPGRQHEPFALTDIQRSYLLGRSPALTLGGLPCQFYYELDCPCLTPSNYHRAWRQLVKRHGMLRTVVLDHRQQQVLARTPPLPLDIHDLRDAPDWQRQLDALRHRIATSVRPHDQWPLFSLAFSHLPDGHWRIHFGLDLLILDQQSFLTLLDEAARLYHDPDTPLPEVEISFRDYLEMTARAQASDNARDYWRARLDSLPGAPALPLARPLEALGTPTFRRLRKTVDADAWASLKQRCQQHGITPSTLLLTLFGETLARWSDSAHFCLNMTLFDRKPVHAHVDRLIGDFTSTLLCEIDLRQASPRLAQVERLQHQLWRDIEHRDYSGMRVMADLAERAGEVGSMLMPVVFTSTLTQNDARLLRHLHLQPGRPVHARGQTAQVLLDNQLTEMEGALLIQWDLVEGAFPGKLPEAMLEHYVLAIHRAAREDGYLLEPTGNVEHPDDTVQALHPDVETAHQCLHDPWRTSWRRHAEQPAIIQGDASLNHRQLAGLACAIAHDLQRHGLRPGDIVPVLLPRCPAQIAACLGVVLAGGAYAPLAADQPASRNRAILDEIGARWLIANPANAEPSLLTGHLCIEVPDAAEPDPTLLAATPPARANDLAYLIYTSGSTGAPKGAMLSHRAALNTVLEINARFGADAQSRVLALSALHFDLSVYDIFGVLGAGGALVLPEPERALEPSHWAELCARHHVNIWNTVPSLFALLVDYLRLHPTQAPEIPLRTVMMSGDWIPMTLPGQALELWPHLHLYSLGGATEAAIWSVCFPITTLDPDWTSIPYGHALGGQQLYVLDERLRIQPPWKEGEIHIAGLGLADGYFKQPEKTAAQFIRHPVTGVRLYRTGDLGRYRDGGLIEFLGRRDQQVKINGFRVETGEISATLLRHPAITEAVVIAAGERHQRHLVAFVSGQVTARDALAAWTAERLPHYMVPSAWHVLEAWPLTANGKLDRVRLETLAATPGAPAAPAAENENALTEQVCALLAEVLKRDRVRPNDSLIELGASSVELISIATHIEARFAFRPRLPDLARSPTVGDIVTLIARHLAPTQAQDTMQWFPEQSTAEAFLRSQKAIHDKQARQLFTQARHALREDLGDILALPDDTPPEAAWFRQSTRHFDDSPITTAQLGMLLNAVRGYFHQGRRKYHYASAGGLNAVQTYLLSPPHERTTLAPGTYYYHPQRHQLQRVGPFDAPDGLAQLSIANRDWLRDAPLLVVLVVELAAIAPLYEQASLPFAQLEAGAMAQLLEMSARRAGLALCHVGDVHGTQLRAALRLGPSQLPLASLAGGVAPPSEQALALSFERDDEEGML